MLAQKRKVENYLFAWKLQVNQFGKSETTGQSPQILFEQVGFESICKKIPKGVKMPWYEEGGYD